MKLSAQASRAPEPETCAAASFDAPKLPLLSGLLERRAVLAPDRVLLQDSARPEPGIWSAGALHEDAVRLGSYLAGLGLPPGALIGLCLPAGRGALVALLAAERAGLTPVLLPLTGKWGPLARQIEATGIQAVLTTATFADERPAERIVEIAARYFRLRFVMAFGPEVPDGVADLDRVLARAAAPARTALSARRREPAGLVTLTRGAPGAAIFRPWSALVAATAVLLDAAQIQAGQRIVSLIAPDDLAGLVTGPLAALLTGATLDAHPLFHGTQLMASLEATGPCHLVAPAWMEPLLARIALPEGVVSVILVHRAPTRLDFRAALARRVVDVLAFSETALLAAPRRPGGLPSLALEAPPESAVSDMLQCKLDSAGQLSFAGPAARCSAMSGRHLPGPDALDGWRHSGFTPEIFAGLVVGVS